MKYFFYIILLFFAVMWLNPFGLYAQEKGSSGSTARTVSSGKKSRRGAVRNQRKREKTWKMLSRTNKKKEAANKKFRRKVDRKAVKVQKQGKKQDKAQQRATRRSIRANKKSSK